jgi:hypothetical protein
MGGSEFEFGLNVRKSLIGLLTDNTLIFQSETGYDLVEIMHGGAGGAGTSKKTSSGWRNRDVKKVTHAWSLRPPECDWLEFRQYHRVGRAHGRRRWRARRGGP